MKKPDWLEKKIQESWYQQVAKRYYRSNATTNSLYIEVMRPDTILVYDGWNYKRGLTQQGSVLKRSDFAFRKINNWLVELASIICFARRTRRDYEWNIIPVLDGHEIGVKPHRIIKRKQDPDIEGLVYAAQH
jgi:hypothetical protein